MLRSYAVETPPKVGGDFIPHSPFWVCEAANRLIRIGGTPMRTAMTHFAKQHVSPFLALD
jgi:hypothetical protein